MGGTRSNLAFIIGYYYDILFYKVLNTNQSYSIKPTNYLFVSIEPIVVSTPEQFDLNLEYSCSHVKTNSRKPVYTRSIETRRYKSKIKIGIRLRICSNLSVLK